MYIETQLKILGQTNTYMYQKTFCSHPGPTPTIRSVRLALSHSPGYDRRASSPSVRLFSPSSRRFPLSSRPLQTLTLISSSAPIAPHELVAPSAARSGVEKDSSVELVGAGAGGEEPTSIELVPIAGEEQFNRVVAEAQQLEESIVILWMANWCRKCIYLKPKLEKLAVDYHPRIRFYCVDVNSVPQKLVNRAGVTKMPTIQLWRDSQKQAEVIGGHKAWLVIDDICRMIEDDE